MAKTDKLAEVHEQLTRAIDELVSGEDWTRFLEASRRMHTYSPNNVLLIMAQRPTATAGRYRTWCRLSATRCGGEKGIGILAPVIPRRRPEEDEDERAQPGAVRVRGALPTSSTSSSATAPAARPSAGLTGTPRHPVGPVRWQVEAAGSPSSAVRARVNGWITSVLNIVRS